MDPSARHLKPWKRGPYLAVLLGALVLLVTWLVVALASLGDGPDGGALCPLVCVGVVLVGLALPAAIWRRRGISRAKTSLGGNEDALAALRGGRYGEAADIWNDLCHESRHAPALHALYVLNLGMTELHLGRLDAARVLIERARASGWFGSSALVHARPNAEVGYALCLALSDDLAGARRTLEPVKATLGESRRAMTMLVDAVIDAREGREVTCDDETLRRAESSLMIAHIRALRLLAAFTHARGKGETYREAAGSDGVEAIGIRPGELDFLCAKWTELRAFMEPRGLLAEA